MATAPAWQTDELQEEWIEEDSDEDIDNYTQSISLTQPIISPIQNNEPILSSSESSPESSSHPVGTFLVHQNIPSAPLLPKTPGRNKRGFKAMKDFFSPLPLERMFEPPSPKSEPETAQPKDDIIETDLPARKTSVACQFTFTAPRGDLLNPNFNDKSLPQAESTPTPPSAAAPLTDPPLRLFQFQYDTFTRDHLSAMVDSIAVNTPSGSTPSPAAQRALSRVSEIPSPSDSFSHLRSAKRVKLSPASDFSDAQVSIARPRLYGKDYVGASRSLMQQIREARDFSTVSTVVSAKQSPAEEKALFADAQSKLAAKGGYSSSKFRQQAADLMAQIKNDMQGQKRVFSGDTEISSDHMHRDEKISFSDKGNQSLPRIPSAASTTTTSKKSYHDLTHGKPPFRSAKDLVDVVSKLTLDDHHPVNVEPIIVQSTHVDPPNPDLLSVPQFYAASSIRSRTNEDLNRFVSSSTASGTTTLTAGSAGSYVKHSGPAQIRTIAPSDVPSLPQKLGNMYFDKALMKWVKQTGQAAAGRDELGEHLPVEESSEDPFEDIESLRDEADAEIQPTELSRVEEQSELDDEEEMELTSFETDNPTARVVDVMTGVATDTSDSDSDDPLDDIPLEGPQIAYETELLSPELPTVEPPVPTVSIAVPRDGGATPSVTPMKSALKAHSTTPSSTLRYQTPMRRGHRRSVSFSDGKRDGPIRGLGRDGGHGDEQQESAVVSFVPSARSKRIANMMEALENSASDDDEDESPSKIYSSGERPEEIQPLAERRSRGPFSGSIAHRSLPTSANATFLTECSFGVAHDRLVQVITDVAPFEPYWDQLTTIDLSAKNVESAARLKEFLPRLDTLNLNSNQLSWLSGLPGSVRTLSVASNRLTSVTSFHHLPHLVSLDISKNDIESISQLGCLRHLRELRADSNRISSMHGIEGLSALVKLSLQGNNIRSVDFAQSRWTRLEMLDLSHNCLDKMSDVACLSSLIALNIDHNYIESFEVRSPMPKLRILRASGNRLVKVNLGPVANLRTLYLDNNSLVCLVKLERLTKLENLSVRNQGGKGLTLLTREIRDVKRAYLSGNPIGDCFLTEACYNLVYLELAGCRLTALPEGFVRLIPNVRALNLNYNFLEDIGGLEGLTRLRKLTVIGSRLKGTKALIRLSQQMPDLETVDFRMNPCTLGWYLPLLTKDDPREWVELDNKFRRDLPDELYIGRLAYRGLVMRGCPRLRVLDGIEIGEKERSKAERLLRGILGKRPR